MMTQEDKKIKANEIAHHVRMECGGNDELIDMVIKSLNSF